MLSKCYLTCSRRIGGRFGNVSLPTSSRRSTSVSCRIGVLAARRLHTLQQRRRRRRRRRAKGDSRPRPDQRTSHGTGRLCSQQAIKENMGQTDRPTRPVLRKPSHCPCASDFSRQRSRQSGIAIKRSSLVAVGTRENSAT